MKTFKEALLRHTSCVLLLFVGFAVHAQQSQTQPKSDSSKTATPTLSIAWPSLEKHTSLRDPRESLSSQMKSDGKCIQGAADFHVVNPSILHAVLMVESGMNPLVISQNQNGTIDVGLGAMNSSHFSELSKFGITPGDLLNDCVATYVAAWQLKKGLNRFGNTWFGVAAYHSTTPFYNNRYQVLIFNQLVQDHVLPATKLQVPHLHQHDP
jgi:hypothetical protein